MNFKKKGFTLLELLVVISIIGILLAVGAVSFTTAQKKSRDSRRKADLNAIQKAMEQCYAIDGEYLMTVAAPSGQLTCDGGGVVMQAVPGDPKDDSAYIESTTGVIWDGTEYKLCADLEGVGEWDGTNEDECVSNLQ